MKHIFVLMFTLLLAGKADSQTQDTVSVRSVINMRSVPESVADSMKNQKNFRYANDMSYWRKKKPNDGDGLESVIDALARSVVFKAIIYSIIIAAILYVLYQVMVVNNFFILSRGKRKKNASTDDTHEVIPENLDEKIDEAVSKGQYRLGIRYLYLKTLKLLSEKGLINLHAQSTNQEYIRQLSGHQHRAQFSSLTRIYEYVWYGEFDPTASQFDIIQYNFNQFNQPS